MVYIAPHVYIEQNGLKIDTGSFSLGVDVKDGSQPADVAVMRVEGAAPEVDMVYPGQSHSMPAYP
jgi:hypothetical protein